MPDSELTAFLGSLTLEQVRMINETTGAMLVYGRQEMDQNDAVLLAHYFYDLAFTIIKRSKEATPCN